MKAGVTFSGDRLSSSPALISKIYYRIESVNAVTFEASVTIYTLKIYYRIESIITVKLDLDTLIMMKIYYRIERLY